LLFCSVLWILPTAGVQVLFFTFLFCLLPCLRARVPAFCYARLHCCFWPLLLLPPLPTPSRFSPYLRARCCALAPGLADTCHYGFQTVTPTFYTNTLSCALTTTKRFHTSTTLRPHHCPTHFTLCHADTFALHLPAFLISSLYLHYWREREGKKGISVRPARCHSSVGRLPLPAFSSSAACLMFLLLGTVLGLHGRFFWFLWVPSLFLFFCSCSCLFVLFCLFAFWIGLPSHHLLTCWLVHTRVLVGCPVL